VLTVAEAVEQSCRNFPDAETLICGSTRLRFDEFYRRCQRLVGAMQARGLQPGDRIAVLAANCHRFVEAFVGLPSGGFIVVPLNYRLTDGELAAILADSGARLLLTDRAATPLADSVEQTLVWPDDYETALAAATPAELGIGVVPEDVAALFYTGGTTGKPKGVMLTHANLAANLLQKIIGADLRSSDVFLAAPAMFHVAGIAPLLSLMALGAPTVVFPMFDPAGCLDALEREGCSVMYPVPTMLAALVDEQRRQPRSLPKLRLFGHAASPISTALLRQAVATFPGVEMAEFYGATETTAIVTALHHEEALLESPLARSCGRPVPGVSVRAIAPDGTERSTGEIGEVVIRSRAVMAGYWQNPSATEAALVDGWYRSGDLGYVDDHGYLFLVDRAKDMIVTGGENVYSIEVENVLATHAAVVEAAVFGIPDDRWGEAVHAVVVVAPSPTAAADDAVLVAALIAHCRTVIAAFKVPKSITIRTEPLPKSGPGKILKRALRDPYWEGRSSDLV
jgi:long-chain acyl-CoA synthetase